MKVVVAGGTGLIRRQVVGMLRSSGRDAVSAAPLTGVGTLTGQGMKQVLKGADVVVDASNSPSFQAKTSLDFFTRSARNLIAAAQRAGVRRYVMLAVIGADQLPENGCFRAKPAQEGVLRDSELPYTIVRATRFFEFIAPVMGLSTREGRVYLPSTQLRPVAAADAAAAVKEEPLYGVRQIAGPETRRLNRLGELTSAAQPDGRRVVMDENAGLFAGIPDGVLTGGTTVKTALTCYEDRLKQNLRKSMIRAGALSMGPRATRRVSRVQNCWTRSPLHAQLTGSTHCTTKEYGMRRLFGLQRRNRRPIQGLGPAPASGVLRRSARCGGVAEPDRR